MPGVWISVHLVQIGLISAIRQNIRQSREKHEGFHVKLECEYAWEWGDGRWNGEKRCVGGDGRFIRTQHWSHTVIMGIGLSLSSTTLHAYGARATRQHWIKTLALAENFFPHTFQWLRMPLFYESNRSFTKRNVNGAVKSRLNLKTKFCQQLISLMVMARHRCGAFPANKVSNGH